MRGMKWIGCLCLMTVLLLMASAADAAERTPLRIARLPLLVQCRTVGDASVDRIETQLDRAMHVPLNGTLQVVQEIPESQVETALDEVLTQLHQSNQRVKLQDAMKPLADKLQADLVVCPVLNDYEQWTEISWNWKHADLLHSYVAMEIAGYDRSSDETFHKSASRFFHDEYSPTGLADTLSIECVDELIQSTELRKRVNAWHTRMPK